MQGEGEFVDFVRLYVEGGRGGDGAVHWRREKYVPRGGPDGGDGGDGGSIYIEGDPSRWTLLDVKYRKFLRAPDGQPGRGRCQTGAQGTDIILKVPLGTVAYDDETGEKLGEILEKGARVCLARGGKGGRGNHAFRSPTLQAPDFAEPGRPGEKRKVRIELKLLADVCLVGPPNAGKSTLLSALTRARPRIAPYPFTTLTPHLGVIQDERGRSLVIADLPGLIAGAHQGKGLGLRFLRHIERGAILLFLLPLDWEDPWQAYEMLRQELLAYDARLLEKPLVIAFSKADLIPPEERHKYLRPEVPHPQLFISGATHEGLSELVSLLYEAVKTHRGPAKSPVSWHP